MNILKIWLNHQILCWKLYWIEYLHLFQSSKLTKICYFLVSQVSPQNKQNSIRKFRAFFQFRAIWHILALVNKFSLYPLHGKAINGKAQIFETLRLWRPLEQREYATSRVLTPEHSYLQNSSNNICIFSSFFNFKLAKNGQF